MLTDSGVTKGGRGSMGHSPPPSVSPSIIFRVNTNKRVENEDFAKHDFLGSALASPTLSFAPTLKIVVPPLLTDREKANMLKY